MKNCSNLSVSTPNDTRVISKTDEEIEYGCEQGYHPTYNSSSLVRNCTSNDPNNEPYEWGPTTGVLVCIKGLY